MGMSRVIDAEKLLAVFAKKYPETQISVKISDPLIRKNNAVFVIEKGKVTRSNPEKVVRYNLETDALVQLLLGYKTSTFTIDYSHVFPEKQPLIGFMME